MEWINKGHEFDNIGETLANAETMYLYGIGGNLKEIWELITSAKKWFNDIEFVFIDKSEKVRNKGFDGKKVIEPKEFFDEISKGKKNYIVVACPLGEVGEEIRTIIINEGVNPDKVLLGFDFLFTYIPVYFMYKYNMVFFTSQNIVPSSACNLNCRDCLNFNPYIKKPVVHTLEEEKRDVDIFFNAVDLIWRFQVTGGEPLLYNHFKELLEYIYERYNDKILRLETVTNGTVIPDDEICMSLAEKQVLVYLDDYRMSLDDDKKKIRDVIENKFKKYGVRYHNNYVDKWFKIYPKTSNENVDLKELFNKCGNPFSTIEDGRITACNYSLYARKAGLVVDDDSDYYDLRDYNPEKKIELMEYRLRYNNKGYTSFCSKCAGWGIDINKNYYYPALQSTKRGYVNEVDK